jgi:hypothetical protein
VVGLRGGRVEDPEDDDVKGSPVPDPTDDPPEDPEAD